MSEQNNSAFWLVERKIRSADWLECYVPVPDPEEGPGAVAVVAEGAKEPVDLEDDEDDDEEEEEAEVAFAVLLEQGKEVAAEASRASSST